MTHPQPTPEWLPHDSVHCPVSPETMVRVRPTYGLDFGWVPASMVTWQNVTSYQISDPASPVGVEKGEGNKVYLASRYSRHPEMRQVRADLEALGYVVTSRWINGDHEMLEGVSTQAHDLERIRYAMEDEADLKAADICISFTEEPRQTKTRGGRHVEHGMALALGKQTIVVGWRENVFHCLPQVKFYDTWAAAEAALSASPSPTPQPPVQESEAVVKGAHTPGPWKVGPNIGGELCVYADTGKPEFAICKFLNITKREVNEANAALIASAPTLSSRVEELERALRDLAEHADAMEAQNQDYHGLPDGTPGPIRSQPLAAAFDAIRSNGRAGE